MSLSRKDEHAIFLKIPDLESPDTIKKYYEFLIKRSDRPLKYISYYLKWQIVEHANKRKISKLLNIGTKKIEQDKIVKQDILGFLAISIEIKKAFLMDPRKEFELRIKLNEKDKTYWSEFINYEKEKGEFERVKWLENGMAQFHETNSE